MENTLEINRRMHRNDMFPKYVIEYFIMSLNTRFFM